MLNIQPNSSQPLVATLYWLPHCSTCQKAKAYLEAKGVSFSTVRNIKTSPLSPVEITALVNPLGSAEALFSKRSLKYRALGLHEQTLNENQLLEHMAAEYTFIKRPVVVFNESGVVLAGFSAKQYDAYLLSRS